MVAHHPPAEFLTDYVAGTVAYPTSVLIAAHMTLCPRCRTLVRDLEHLGGLMLEEMAAAPGEAAGTPWPDAARTTARSQPAPDLQSFGADFPRPLAALLASAPNRLRWRRRLPGLAEMRIGGPGRAGDPDIYLIRMPGGRGMWRHTHAGFELTLVLSGSFNDGCVRYMRGDVAYADGDTRHAPAADPGADCICLVVQDAPIKLSLDMRAALARLLPF